MPNQCQEQLGVMDSAAPLLATTEHTAQLTRRHSTLDKNANTLTQKVLSLRPR